MSILFINSSPNHNGNTAKLARVLLAGHDYQTLDLADYKLYAYGQNFADDQLDDVMTEVAKADTIVIGSPVYWHNLNGLLRNFLDRQYGRVAPEFAGKRLFFLFQGQAPTPEILAAGEYTMSRFAGYYDMDYMGMAHNASEAKQLASKV